MKLKHLYTICMFDIIKCLLVLFVCCCSVLSAQDAMIDTEDEYDIEETEVLKLEDQKIRIEPVNPTLTLARRYIKPKDFLFFRSFEDEVKDVPDDLFDINLEKSEVKIKNYKDLINRKRK